MSAIEGGLRDRFIEEGLYRVIFDTLDDLGWLDENREHTPITVISRPIPPGEAVPANTLNVLNASIGGDNIELGSNLSEDRHLFWVDFYGESDALARHVIGDVRDSLRGKLPSIGRAAAVIPVYDFRLEDEIPDSVLPDPVFVLDVDRVVEERAHTTTREWEKHWYSLQVELLDEH